MAESYTLTMEILYQLPDGTYAILAQRLSYGDIIQLILLSALVFLQVITLFTNRKQ